MTTSDTRILINLIKDNFISSTLHSKTLTTLSTLSTLTRLTKNLKLKCERMTKLTAKDAQEWARQSFIAGLKIGAGDAEDIVECNYQEHGEDEIADHVTGKMMDTFRPVVEKRSMTANKDSSERSVLDFNPDRCCARVWNHGFGGQCTKKHLEDGTLCKGHQNTKDKLPEGDELKHGYFNHERPLFMLTAADGREKGDTIAWADLKDKIKADKSAKKKVTAAKKSTKKSPAKDVKFSRPKGRGPKGKTWDYDNGEWIDLVQCISPVEQVEVVDDAAGVGEIKEEVVEGSLAEARAGAASRAEALAQQTPPAEVVTAVEELVCKTEGDNGESRDLDIDNDDEDEKITYDGVEYIYDKDQQEVYTVNDMELMGTWNPEDQKIIWEDDDEGPKMHEQLKNE